MHCAASFSGLVAFFNASHMKLIRVAAHVGGPGSRRYDHCTDPFAARGETSSASLHESGLVQKRANMRLKHASVCLESNSQTLLLPVALRDEGFIPLSDLSGAKASVFTGAALNYECVGGWEFLITTP